MRAVVLGPRNTKSIPVKTGLGRVTAFLKFFAESIELGRNRNPRTDQKQKNSKMNRLHKVSIHENSHSHQKNEESVLVLPVVGIIPVVRDLRLDVITLATKAVAPTLGTFLDVVRVQNSAKLTHHLCLG